MPYSWLSEALDLSQMVKDIRYGHCNESQRPNDMKSTVKRFVFTQVRGCVNLAGNRKWHN